MKTHKNILTKLVFTALFAALISAGAFIVIPFVPVPIVLQNMFALLAGLILGPLYGSLSVVLFITAGVLGAPVFVNNAQAMGIARIIRPTGGYLAGYILAALTAGLIAGTPGPAKNISLWRLILAVSAGLCIVYLPGLFYLRYSPLHGLTLTWKQTFFTGLFPFLPGDLVKGIIAVLIAPRLRRTSAQLVFKL
jgi:biotin transport system substrate-specific component